MKILIVLTYYHPHWTGLSAYAKRLAEGLTLRGHEVTVITSRYHPSLSSEEVVNGVRVVRLPVFRRISRGVVTPGLPARLWRMIAEADIVQMHTPLLEAPLVALFGRLLRRPVVITHHGDLVMPGGLYNQAIERSVTQLMTLALRLANAITVHSRDYAQHSAFLHPFSQKVDCIYPPVVIPEPDLQRVSMWKEALGLNGRPAIGFAGRWVEEKGFDYLLQAIPHVLQTFPNAQFLYAGDTQVVYEDFFARCQPYLEPVRQKLTMVGLIKDAGKLADFYRMCDVFVLPSRTDCFPSVQIEAMLCGTPVVTADIPGAREAVQVTGMGRLALPGQPADIANGIIEVLQNRQRYLRSREELERIFSLQQGVSQYEALMTRLAQAGGVASLHPLTVEVRRD